MELAEKPQHERHQPENVNEKHKNRLGLQDRIALLVTTAVGTMYAVYVITLVMAGWMLWETVFDHHPFDPYPFAFLLFLGNLVELLLMPLIMVGQNIQGRHAEIRSEEEYKTTTTSYKDIEYILKILEVQNQELIKQSKMLEELAKKK